MVSFPTLLAAAQTFSEEVNHEMQRPRFNTRDLLLMVAVGLLVGGGLLYWAYFKFRPKNSVAFGPEESKHPVPGKQKSNDRGEDGARNRKRKRHRRREHRPRNPTLSETGGLPPQRPDGELPKY